MSFQIAHVVSHSLWRIIIIFEFIDSDEFDSFTQVNEIFLHKAQMNGRNSVKIDTVCIPNESSLNIMVRCWSTKTINCASFDAFALLRKSSFPTKRSIPKNSLQRSPLLYLWHPVWLFIRNHSKLLLFMLSIPYFHLDSDIENRLTSKRDAP